MKKVLFTVSIIIVLITRVFASSYSCEITGDDEIYSNSNKSSYITVNIENIKDIKSFRMYIKYENKKYKVDTCQFLNYNTTSCFLRTNDKSLIYYDYNYNKDYSLEDYPFFYANFKSIEKTPSEGQTTIVAYFEDVKDMNNKSVKIEDCSKILTFKKGEDEAPTKVDKLGIEIEGFNFEFDEKTYEYNLYVDQDINSLDIKVNAPENYKYKVNGATDLNTFGNKITIVINDPDNNEVTYTINVVREKAQIVPTDIKKEAKNFIKDLKNYLPSIIVALVVVFLILGIAQKKDNNKIDKHLDNL